MTPLHGIERTSPDGAGVASTLRMLAVLACVILAIWLLSDIVLLIFMAVLIAVILRGSSRWIAQRTGVAEGPMLAVVTIGSFLLLAGFLYYIGPKLANESQDLWTQLHQQVEQLQQTYGNTSWGHALFQHASPTKAVQDNVFSYARSVATSTLGSLASAFILIVTALYFAISPELYITGVTRLFPLPWRPRTRHVLIQVGRTLQWWSLGQLIDMAVVGVLTGIGLSLLGVPLSLALGVLAGLFTFVPYFGAIAAAVPAMLVALTVSWQTSLWALAIFLCCHGIEGYLVSPLVQRRTVHLPPALSILSMAILGTIFGPLGIILGTPVVAAVMVIVREAYVGGVLRDPEVLGEDEAQRPLLPHAAGE